MKTGRYRLTEVLWYTQKIAVYREIASIMELDSVDATTPGWFKHRTEASKNIIDAMTEQEKKELEDEAERLWKNGLPLDEQRR